MALSIVKKGQPQEPKAKSPWILLVKEYPRNNPRVTNRATLILWKCAQGFVSKWSSVTRTFGTGFWSGMINYAVCGAFCFGSLLIKYIF